MEVCCAKSKSIASGEAREMTMMRLSNVSPLARVASRPRSTTSTTKILTPLPALQSSTAPSNLVSARSIPHRTTAPPKPCWERPSRASQSYQDPTTSSRPNAGALRQRSLITRPSGSESRSRARSNGSEPSISTLCFATTSSLWSWQGSEDLGCTGG